MKPKHVIYHIVLFFFFLSFIFSLMAGLFSSQFPNFKKLIPLTDEVVSVIFEKGRFNVVFSNPDWSRRIRYPGNLIFKVIDNKEKEVYGISRSISMRKYHDIYRGIGEIMNEEPVCSFRIKEKGVYRVWAKIDNEIAAKNCNLSITNAYLGITGSDFIKIWVVFFLLTFLWLGIGQYLGIINFPNKVDRNI